MSCQNKKTCSINRGYYEIVRPPLLKLTLIYAIFKIKDIVEPQRIYEMEDIIKICQLYMEIMEQWVDTPDKEERRCFILEKERPRFDLDKK